MMAGRVPARVTTPQTRYVVIAYVPTADIETSAGPVSATIDVEIITAAVWRWHYEAEQQAARWRDQLASTPVEVQIVSTRSYPGYADDELREWVEGWEASHR